MFLFILPFIADGVAKDWPRAVATLRRTLGSILANPEQDLRAMVICQDNPPLDLKDGRYIYLKTDHPKPDKNEIMAKHHDKGVKTGLAFEVAQDLAAEYVMIVDADDLVSSSLVSYVRARPEWDAFCMQNGYEWREGASYFIRRNNFNLVCGSAFVWRLNERLFPAWVGKNYSVERIADQGHNLVEAAMDAKGFRVQKMRQPKAVYVTGHVNHMYEDYHQRSMKRRIKELLLSPLRNQPLTNALRMEFTVPST